MIITRTPLRISFVGGGSDRPSFYLEEPGACVAAAIDRYVYVTVSDKYDGTFRAAYSVTENVARPGELRHELIREALTLSARDRGTEIHSIADLPAGTGLGSSSSFTVGLLHALQPDAPRRALAERACTIEIARCQKPIGKQDQYAAAYGGVNLLGFSADGVAVRPLKSDPEALSSHCVLLDTGLARVGDAGDVLSGQQQDRDDVRELVKLALLFADDLAGGDLVGCGILMDMAWTIKRAFCSTPLIDAWYKAARQAGAWGGKLCGAGGGGFLLFLAPPERHAAIVQALNLRHVPIRVGVTGSEVVYRD